MNFLMQLKAANSVEKKTLKRVSSKPPYEAQVEAAVERYRKAMIGKGWMRRTEIEKAMNMQPQSSTYFLQTLRNKLKLIERRILKGVKEITYEYKWKE